MAFVNLLGCFWSDGAVGAHTVLSLIHLRALWLACRAARCPGAPEGPVCHQRSPRTDTTHQEVSRQGVKPPATEGIDPTRPFVKIWGQPPEILR